MIAKNPIIGVLSAPLGFGWTVERLAEQVLSVIAMLFVAELRAEIPKQRLRGGLEPLSASGRHAAP